MRLMANYFDHLLSLDTPTYTVAQISINQSKFIFQVITEYYNVINAVALEGLPEKHYAYLDWSPEQRKQHKY